MANGVLHEERLYKLELKLSEEECRILSAWMQNPMGNVHSSQEDPAERNLRKEIWKTINPGMPSNS